MPMFKQHRLTANKPCGGNFLSQYQQQFSSSWRISRSQSFDYNWRRYCLCHCTCNVSLIRFGKWLCNMLHCKGLWLAANAVSRFSILNLKSLINRRLLSCRPSVGRLNFTMSTSVIIRMSPVFTRHQSESRSR